MILGTTAFLNKQPDLVVRESAKTPADALEKLKNYSPDVAVLEVSLMGPYDIPFLRKLRRTHPSLPVLAYSYHEEVIFARRALNSGANGYLMKEAEPYKLAEALRYTVAGKVYLSERVTARIEKEKTLLRENRERELNGALVNSLSDRELQIFQFLGDGYSMERIRKELNLSRNTTRNACYRVRRKLGLHTDSELLQFAAHWAYYEGDFS